MAEHRRAEILDPVEVACGMPIGGAEHVSPLPPGRPETPRAALEAIVTSALLKPPCVVSFSGGHDSSAILALAVHVARREGLPLPLPVTLVFPGVSKTDESAWRNLVLSHLGLDDHVRLEFTDELDAVGPVAQEALRRHGLLWPANLHFHLPIFDAARGGTLLTGGGGDELGRADGAMHGEWLLAGRRVRSPRDAAVVAYRLAPGSVKWAREYARADTYMTELPWLTKRARRVLRGRLAREYTVPFGYRALISSYYWRRRSVQTMRRNFEIVAEAYDVTVTHPFSEPRTLQALAATGGLAGHGDRYALYRDLFGDLLPAELAERDDKSTFNDPLWTATATTFAARWSGRGLDTATVDPEVVRREWLSGGKGLIATTMLQAAWLYDDAAGRSADSPSVSSSTSPSSTS